MMKNKIILKTTITIIAVIIICIIAAMYSPPGFSHAIGMLTKDGGKARHAILLGFGKKEYVILATGTVKAPYRGSVRVTLEGEPKIDYKIYSFYPPAIKLGSRNSYKFENNMLKNLSPWDKFSLIIHLKQKDKIDKEAEYYLKFYDTDSNNTVLSMPIFFRELSNFHISKDTRRAYDKYHCPKSKSNHLNNKPNCCKK